MSDTSHAKRASPTPWSFRYDATPADRDAVRRIVESTGFFNPDEAAVAVELVDERLARGPASGYQFVFAERDAQVRGYTCYGHVAGTAASFDLYWIAVDAPARRGGLGRLLLAESERLIREAGGQRVYIETSNRSQYVSTRGFYERCGYRLEAVLKDFYAPGDDKAIYVKAL
jgi:ribosomal protein S18 acetylase RimI-like enzyme